jgi:hypothetical protein
LSVAEQLVIWRYISVNVTSELPPHLNSFVPCFSLLEFFLD